MFDSIPAHIKLIQGHNILWKIVANAVIDAKLPLNRILRGQQVSYLDILEFQATEMIFNGYN